MGTLTQTVLPFKIEATEELLTANAGLMLFGEFTQGLGLTRWLTQEMPKPGSGRGYEAVSYVTPLILMLTTGGRRLVDLRTLKNDEALAQPLKLAADEDHQSHAGRRCFSDCGREVRRRNHLQGRAGLYAHDWPPSGSGRRDS